MEQHQSSICYIMSIEILHHIFYRMVLSELFSYQWRWREHCKEQKQEKDLKMVNW